MGHHAGERGIRNQKIWIVAAGDGHRGATHHAAVGCDAVSEFKHQTGGFRERLTGCQFVDHLTRGDAHAAAVVERPIDQAVSEVAGVVNIAQQRISQIDGLGEVVVQGSVGFARVDLGKAVGVRICDVIVRGALDGQAQQIADGETEQHASCTVT